MQNGVNTMTLQVNGDRGIAVPNPGMASEVTIDTSGLSAEQGQGGIRINYIPRDGGNTFSGSTVRDVREQRHAERQPHRRSAGARAAVAQRHQDDLRRQSRRSAVRSSGIGCGSTSPDASTAPTSIPGGAFVNVNGYDPHELHRRLRHDPARVLAGACGRTRRSG